MRAIAVWGCCLAGIFVTGIAGYAFFVVHFTLLHCFVVGCTVRAGVDVAVFKEYYVLLGADDGFYLFEIGSFGGFTLFGACGVVALFLLFGFLDALFASFAALFVEFLQTGFLRVGEVEAVKRIYFVAASLTVTFLSFYIFLRGSVVGGGCLCVSVECYQ